MRKSERPASRSSMFSPSAILPTALDFVNNRQMAARPSSCTLENSLFSPFNAITSGPAILHRPPRDLPPPPTTPNTDVNVRLRRYARAHASRPTSPWPPCIQMSSVSPPDGLGCCFRQVVRVRDLETIIRQILLPQGNYKMDALLV